MTDTLQMLGKLISHQAGSDVGRDAVHIAVAPVVAGEKLKPADAVFFRDTSNLVYRSSSITPVGIIDPFLKYPVKTGERCWLFLYPTTITSLRHVWTHPAFPDELPSKTPVTDKLVSEQWLKDFCARSDCPSYFMVMEAAEHVAMGGSGSTFDDDYLHFNDYDAHGEIPDEFWDHVEVVLGKKIKGRRCKYFSCSC